MALRRWHVRLGLLILVVAVLVSLIALRLMALAPLAHAPAQPPAHITQPIIPPAPPLQVQSATPPTPPTTPQPPPPVPRPSTYWLRGLVLTLDHQPLPPLTVQLFDVYEPFASPRYTRTVLSPSGEFELEWTSAGPVDLVVRAAGFTEGVVPQVELAVSRDEAVRWELVLVPEARISGRVVNNKGQPVPGAQVEFRIYYSDVHLAGAPAEEDQAALEAYQNEADPNPRTRTDQAGAFGFTGLPQGTYQLIASHPEYYPVGKEVALQPGMALEGVELVLSTEGGLLTVQITDVQERPVAGQTVKVDGTPLEGVTDPQGRWRAEDLPPGIYRVVVPVSNADGRPGGTRWADTFVVAGKESHLVFRLHAGVIVMGEVTRADQPVTGVEVTVSQMKGMEGRPVDPSEVSYATVTERTDGNGRFEFSALPPGQYSCIVSAGEDRMIFRFVLAETDHHRSFRVRLGSGTVEGMVRDAQTGTPIHGASVSFLPLQLDEDKRADDDIFAATVERELVTDASGRYRLDGVAPGAYALGVAARGYGSILSQTVQVTGPLFQHNVALWPQAKLLVSVTDARGLPIHRARMTLHPVTEPDKLLVAASNSQGLVSLENVAPGTYEISVDSGASSEPSDRTVLDIKPGQTHRLSMRLTSP